MKKQIKENIRHQAKYIRDLGKDVSEVLKDALYTPIVRKIIREKHGPNYLPTEAVKRLHKLSDAKLAGIYRELNRNSLSGFHEGFSAPYGNMFQIKKVFIERTVGKLQEPVYDKLTKNIDIFVK